MAGPILGVALVAVALAGASRLVGEARVHGDDAIARAQANETTAERQPRDAGVDASWRFDEGGAIVAPPGDEAYRCLQPQVDVPQSDGCATGAGYPECRWQLPEPTDGEYEIWRNTTDDHRWGRPGLVSLMLATAAEYRRRWPGEHVVIGDLDAPGPRHQTHDRGVDVDLYLPDAMIARNAGGGRYPDNYENKSRREVRLLRARVMDLAKILATCADGQIRIYYNDHQLVRDFRAWFDERGMQSEVGRPMRPHNRLHRFHFHLTVPEDLDPQPAR